MKILLRRSGALGDVILTTPIVRLLRKQNPRAEIVVQTGYPAVYRDNPYVSTVNVEGAFDRTINLDLAYERRPNMHIVDAYLQEAFPDNPSQPDENMQQELFHPKGNRAPYRAHPNLIVVHGPGASWRSRTRDTSFWHAVHTGLQTLGYYTVAVGSHFDRVGGASADMRGKLDLHGLYRLIDAATCFVGGDSGPLHVAGATSTPIVGLFTSARAQYRLPMRQDLPADGCKGLEPNLDCVGCLHRETPPVTSVGCPLDHYGCVDGPKAVSPSDVITAVAELLRKLRKWQQVLV